MRGKKEGQDKSGAPTPEGDTQFPKGKQPRPGKSGTGSISLDGRPQPVVAGAMHTHRGAKGSNCAQVIHRGRRTAPRGGDGEMGRWGDRETHSHLCTSHPHHSRRKFNWQGCSELQSHPVLSQEGCKCFSCIHLSFCCEGYHLVIGEGEQRAVPASGGTARPLRVPGAHRLWREPTPSNSKSCGALSAPLESLWGSL